MRKGEHREAFLLIRVRLLDSLCLHDAKSVFILLPYAPYPNKYRVFVLKDLYDHDVICPHYHSTGRPIIDELFNCGDLRYGSTLFSEPEQAYLNYHLNQAEFSNGLDLRNRYIHSTYSLDESVQEHDYDCLLRIMALVIMKINEEFCLKYPLTSNANEST